MAARAEWEPVVVHPVKDAATEQMLRDVADEPDPVVQERSAEALAFIASERDGPTLRTLPTRPTRPTPSLSSGTTSGSGQALPAGGDEFAPAGLHAADVLTIERAVAAAGRTGAAEAVPDLLPLLEHADEGLRQAVLETLQALAPAATNKAEVVGALTNRLDREPSLRVCEAAGQVFVSLHDGLAERAVVGLLAHRSPLVRLAAVHALADWNDRALAPQLHARLGDSDAAVAGAAAEALEKLGNADSRAALRERLPAAPATVQVEIAQALAAFDDQEAIPLLLQLVGGASDAAGAAAAEALGAIGAMDAVAGLRGPLTNVKLDEHNTRREAIRALRRLGDRGTGDAIWRIATQAVVPTPMGSALDKAEVREEGLRYLADAGERRYAELLVNVAADPRAELQSIIGAALPLFERVGDAALLEDLLNHLGATPPAAARLAICDTLQRMTGRAYEPLPDQSHRHYFVESLARWSFDPLPRPPGVKRVE